MRTLTGAMDSAVASTVTAPAYLVEILWTTPLRVVTAGQLTAWNSRTWVPYAFTVSGVAQAKEDAKVSIKIGNTGLEISALVLSEGAAGQRVKVWQFWGASPATADPVLVFSGLLDGADIADDTVILHAVSAGGIGLYAPRRLICAEQGFSVLPVPGTVINWGGKQFELKTGE